MIHLNIIINKTKKYFVWLYTRSTERVKSEYNNFKSRFILFLRNQIDFVLRIRKAAMVWLASEPQKRIAIIGSDGLFHICTLVVVLGYGIYRYYTTVNISPTIVHNIRLSFNQIINPDSFNLFDNKCYGIESCSVLIYNERVNKLTKGKYHNAIELKYIQDDIVYKDSVEIKITRTPHSHPIECFVVNNDSLIPAKKLSDSIQVSSFLPEMTDKIVMPTLPDIMYTHILICCDDFGIDELNPNYCYRLLLGGNNSRSFGNAPSFKFILGEEDDKNHDDFNYFSERAISYDQLIPIPDINFGNAIIYKDSTKIREIFNSGIYIKATDLDKEHKRDNEAFQSSVIAGLFFAFALDIIVQLVIKWRNLTGRKKEEDEQ